MLTTYFNSKAALRFARFLCLALLSGLIFFFLVAVYLSNETLFFKFDTKDPFTFVALILTCTSIPVGYIYSRKIFKSYKPGNAFSQKYPIYQTGLIIRLAFCEGVGLFSTVCLLLSSNLFFVLFFLIAVLAMISNYPTPEKIGEAIELTPGEIESFYINPSA